MKTNNKNCKSVSKDADELIEIADSKCYNPLHRRDYSSAFQLYKEAEKLGSVVAIDRIGRCYWDGFGVDKDLHQAAIHFLKAARMGNASAMYNLGLFMNGEGKGSKIGQERAIYWFEKAAENGIKVAYWNLGYAYLNGEGVKVDYWKAMHWFRKGGDLGTSECYVQIGLMYYHGLGIPADDKKAVNWFQKAVMDDNSDAHLYLGYCYEHGHGVRKSLKKADEHYEKADMFGNVNALEEIFAFENRHPLFKLYKKTLMMIQFMKCHIKYSCLSC